MPALFTTMSMRPKLSIAVCTIFCAFSHSATLSVFATARPAPFAWVISATTCSAGPTSWPSPVTAAPTSQTTTLAPFAARQIAVARPMPRPAPVTTATLPSSIPAIRVPSHRQ